MQNLDEQEISTALKENLNILFGVLVEDVALAAGALKTSGESVVPSALALVITAGQIWVFRVKDSNICDDRLANGVDVVSTSFA